MKVGLIHNTHRFVHDCMCPGRLELVSFTISPDRLSFYEIFDSAFASPARYVMEVSRRLNSKAGKYDNGKFIFNPLLELDNEQIARVLGVLEKAGNPCEPFIVADSDNFPLGYYLPESILSDEEHFLTLLSTVNARLDQELLNAIYCANGLCINVGCSVLEFVGNRFPYNEELWFIYEWLSRRALSLLKKIMHQRRSSLYPATRDDNASINMRTLRDGVKFCAVMPHHAGDVLFYTIAAKHTDSHVSSIVVNRRYANIVDDLLPEYASNTIDRVPPYRDCAGMLQSDESNFLDFASELLPFSFYHYLRPSRDYNATDLHLIDHFAFALGKSNQSLEMLVTAVKSSPPVFQLESGPPYRVLLHFDAGWGLKIYPKEYQSELIKKLLNEGMEITILGTVDQDFGRYRSVNFKGLEPLKDLLKSHHLLVGSDSFPSHYAAHVLGLPTICMFGPTKPVNSDMQSSQYYKAVEVGLSCCPCGVLETCLKTGRNRCENLVTPMQIKEEIDAMLTRIYGTEYTIKRK